MSVVDGIAEVVDVWLAAVVATAVGGNVELTLAVVVDDVEVDVADPAVVDGRVDTTDPLLSRVAAELEHADVASAKTPTAAIVQLTAHPRRTISPGLIDHLEPSCCPGTNEYEQHHAADVHNPRPRRRRGRNWTRYGRGVALFDLSHKPTGWQRRVLKAPTYIFRARLGLVFGHRLLMLEHRGRSSDNLYRTVIEVAGRTESEWICSSGTGPHADWYRNLKAGGLEAVWIGSHRHQATVRFLEADEAAGFMAAYEHGHPKTAAKLYEAMGVSYDGSHDDLVRMMHQIPMVGFATT